MRVTVGFDRSCTCLLWQRTSSVSRGLKCTGGCKEVGFTFARNASLRVCTINAAFMVCSHVKKAPPCRSENSDIIILLLFSAFCSGATISGIRAMIFTNSKSRHRRRSRHVDGVYAIRHRDILISKERMIFGSTSVKRGCIMF